MEDFWKNPTSLTSSAEEKFVRREREEFSLIQFSKKYQPVQGKKEKDKNTDNYEIDEKERNDSQENVPWEDDEDRVENST